MSHIVMKILFCMFLYVITVVCFFFSVKNNREKRTALKVRSVVRVGCHRIGMHDFPIFTILQHFGRKFDSVKYYNQNIES